MSNSWYKIWVVGNGGIPWGDEYIRMPSDADDDDMAYEVERHFGPLPSTVRSCNWEKVETLPIEVIKEKLDEYIRSKNNAEIMIKKLEEMRATIEKTVNAPE